MCAARAMLGRKYFCLLGYEHKIVFGDLAHVKVTFFGLDRVFSKQPTIHLPTESICFLFDIFSSSSSALRTVSKILLLAFKLLDVEST